MKSAFAESCDGYLKRVGHAGDAARAHGFILPLTLWMIALTGLLAAALNVWVASAVANAESLARRIELQLAQSNLRNELVYLLGTRPTSFRGLEVGKNITFADGANFNAILAGPSDSGRYIKFDGRSYTSESTPDLVIAVQDGTGLINLNIATSVNLRRVLTSFDLPEAQVNRLIDTLLDYIDDDDFTRLAGAERTQYARLGLPAPANGLLMTPAEAQRVMGWDQLGSLWEADMASPLFTTCQSAGFNPNNAPPQALVSSVRGMTREKAEQVLAARSKRPFRNTAEFGAAADLLITDEPFFYTFIPGPCVVVDLVDKRSRQHARFALTLEPVSMTRPWRVDYATTIPAQYSPQLDHLDPEAVFPAPESVDPAAAGADNGKLSVP
jgi:hypothetical protein